jgi:hypothetical protein
MSKGILILRGVYISKIANKQINDTNYLEHNTEEKKDNKNSTKDSFNKLPTKYTKGNWIKKTNLKCWKCDRKFNSVPYFIATKSLEDPTGNFCSPGCAKRFILYDVNGPHKWEMEKQLYNLFYDLNGYEANSIDVAPDKTIRIEYGGSITDEEFENLVNNCVR